MKRSPHLRRLSLEHQAALSLASRVERNARSAAMSELPVTAATVERCWHAELAPHFAVEERVWLPAFRAAGLRELAERTAAEHRALAALATGHTLPLRERLARFAALLQAHVRFEERELFEAAQGALSDPELDALARAAES